MYVSAVPFKMLGWGAYVPTYFNYTLSTLNKITFLYHLASQLQSRHEVPSCHFDLWFLIILINVGG